MTTSTKPTSPRCPFAGIAATNERSAVFITAQVAGQERRYIIPTRQFTRFASGENARGINRDLLNDGFPEEAESVKLVWDGGAAYLQDCFYDPFGEWRVAFPRGTVADLFVMDRSYVFLGGREHIRMSWRLSYEIKTQMRTEIKAGISAPVHTPVYMREVTA